MRSTLSKNIQSLRKQKELTQTDLAELLGTSRAVIGSYEESRAEPSIGRFLEMCKLFKKEPFQMYLKAQKPNEKP